VPRYLNIIPEDFYFTKQIYAIDSCLPAGFTFLSSYTTFYQGANYSENTINPKNL
jgi:hypothetical protein